jgi:hypothetical protein
MDGMTLKFGGGTRIVMRLRPPGHWATGSADGAAGNPETHSEAARFSKSMTR